MPCLPLTREVDFCEAKRRWERKVKDYPSVGCRRQLARRERPPFVGYADISPAKRGNLPLTRGAAKYLTRLRVGDNLCTAGRPIKSALVRSQYRIGLCPKMKYPPLCGGIIIISECNWWLLTAPSLRRVLRWRLARCRSFGRIFLCGSLDHGKYFRFP